MLRRASRALLTRTFTPKVVAPATVRSLSTFSDRERGEEARYIREQEALKIAKARAEFEKLLAQDGSHEQRQEVLQLLAPEKPSGLLSKLGLDDWKIALPLGIIAAIPAIANEILILSAETQLVAVFIFSVGTAYNQVGSSLAASLDEGAEEVKARLAKVDESIISEVHSNVESAKELLDLDKDVNTLNALVDDLAVTQAEVLNLAAEHKYRESIVKKLDALVTVEEKIANAVKTRMIKEVKADVIKTFTTDKKASNAALEAALAVLQAGGDAKRGVDVVGNVYKSSLKANRDNYSKVHANDEILVQLQKEIAAIAVAPVVDGTGGNVYESHPVVKA